MPPATPVIAECTLEPLQPEALAEIVAQQPMPVRELTPSSEAPATDDVAAATKIIEQSLACTNANQPLAALAAYTDRYLNERFGGAAGSDELGHLLAAATRNPDPAAPEDAIVLVQVTDPVLYSDGRLGLTVVTANATGTFTDQLILTREGDRWKIDDVILGDGPESTPASPVAQP
jgi:hypothetical protein